MPLKDLTTENFDSETEAAPLIIIDFWATWCGPCKGFAPIFEAAAAKHPDILFAKIDTDAQQEIAAQFQIRSIPTVLFVKDGTVVKVQTGAAPPDKFEKAIQEMRDA